MGKRRRTPDEPLLFDLPLREEPDEDLGAANEEGDDEQDGEEPEADEVRAGANDDAGEDAGSGRDATEVARLPAATLDRLLAGLADFAVLVLVGAGAVAAVLAMGLRLAPGDWPPFAVLVLVFSFLYWVIPLAFWGQTPGMTWIGQLARSETDEPLSFGQAVRRWLGAVLTLALVGLPLLLAAFGGRSLSDRLSGSKTLVL